MVYVLTHRCHFDRVRRPRERTRATNRIKGLLALHGVVLLTARGLPRDLPDPLRAWDGAPLPPQAAARLTREWRRLGFLRREVRALIAERRRWLRGGDDAVVAMVWRLLALGTGSPPMTGLRHGSVAAAPGDSQPQQRHRQAE